MSVNLIKLKSVIIVLLLIILYSCSNIQNSPDGAVVAFIVAAEQRDMSKAWNILSPELQNYYNGLGEKMRKSGKGALENEIAGIIKFRSVKKDYKLIVDSTNKNNVNLVTIGGPTHLIETIDIDGYYKIKDEKSLRNLLNGITAESKKKESY
ncbi:MAG: hypothetical protein IT280_02320 [Ignavibacteria bacterium]|nr:hypothetical protein [Ignavibacteria bacterium]